MLDTACNIFGRLIEVDKKVAKDGNIEESEGAVAALFGESMFHTMTFADDDDIPEEYECIEFGQDSQSEIDQKIGI